MLAAVQGTKYFTTYYLPMHPTMTQELWYKNAIIYSLDLETFMDYNGDGVGDFQGLARRLDYLHALGVDTLWLAPFQPTPNQDNGYDIKDYYGVDPRHGSSGNFVEFMHQANKRGMKVIIDLVANHTSIEHPWFQDARSSKDAKHRDWYVWSEEKPEDWDEGMVFPGVQKSTWTYDNKAKAYYHHRFYKFQPDLNMDNPEVRAEINRIIGFWLELGVAGFRVDAVPFMLESHQGGKQNPKYNFDYLRDLRRFLQWRKGDAVLLGEANVLPKESKEYFGYEGSGIHLMFNFYVNQYMFYALATADIEPLKEALEATRITFPTSQWAHFLRNHDELDLGRLTEEQRQRVFDRFGPEEHMQLYHRGIRRRLSPMLGNRQQTELAYSLMFSLPGTPVIRYGDEIGMGDNLELKERDAVRTPMQWSGDKQAGFSEADKLVHPVIEEGPYAYHHVNVETQRRTPDSLLNWMTTMIRLRHECTEIGWGDWKLLETGNKYILGMHYSWQDSSLLIFHNFDEKAHEAILDQKEHKEHRLIDLMRNVESHADEKGRHCITLEAYGYRWFRTADLSHLLQKG
ncbi:alpha-amylase family protein [Pontibacter chinhatensis]|uniref:Maltose alpha-D-glucosyltransferase/ alpha-amylase n=1 Tax=Pontibacter chinhatensis TaxID=1436961 RepID=A0A1I2MWG6_9BACT|nr:alpha-amylase family protein [Pontibacter chinhatensis]SFF95783.1 maltose alpha-D-glucosyltransferase/ alpha-amylase [Pontibacter chinhatensis]